MLSNDPQRLLKLSFWVINMEVSMSLSKNCLLIILPGSDVTGTKEVCILLRKLINYIISI